MSNALATLTGTRTTAPPTAKPKTRKTKNKTTEPKANQKGGEETIEMGGVVLSKDDIQALIGDDDTHAPKAQTEKPKAKDRNPKKTPRHPAPMYQAFIDAILDGLSPADAHASVGMQPPHSKGYTIVKHEAKVREVLSYHGLNVDALAQGDPSTTPTPEEPSEPEPPEPPLTADELEQIISKLLREPDVTAGNTKSLIEALGKLRPIERPDERAEVDPCAVAEYLTRYAGSWCSQVSEQAELTCWQSIIRFTGWTPERMAELSHLLAKGQQVPPPTPPSIV